MPSHAERRYAAYAPAQIYELVADVESYPAFLPWCTACRIYGREDNVLYARLGVGFKAISESFRSRVTLDPIERIDIAYLDGPFRHLDSSWKFSPQDDGCLIDFFIDFEFRSLLLRKIMGPLFNEVVRRSVGAFIARGEGRGRSRPAGSPRGSEIDPALDPFDRIARRPAQPRQVRGRDRRQHGVERIAARVVDDSMPNRFIRPVQ